MGQPKWEGDYTGSVSTATRARPSSALLQTARTNSNTVGRRFPPGPLSHHSPMGVWINSGKLTTELASQQGLTLTTGEKSPRRCGVLRAETCGVSYPGPPRSLVHGTLVTIPPSVMPPDLGIHDAWAWFWENEKKRKEGLSGLSESVH